MRPEKILAHEFVEFIPDVLREGTLYVSMQYAIVVHKCCCGCGHEVVTPLSPTDWTFIFDGRSISLEPSIGNWSFDCQSHYWIKGSRVIWARRWSKREIDAGRARDRFAKERYFKTARSATERALADASGRREPEQVEQGFWQMVKEWWHRLK
jgi:hypothetical protein